MTIATATDLIQRCQDWLFGRNDLAPRVPDFITLFEAKANRVLMVRQMETRSVSMIDLSVAEPEFLRLPCFFQTMRRVRILNPNVPVFGGFPSRPRLKFATSQQLDDLRSLHGAPGAPIWFTLFANQMEVLPVPDFAYQMEMVYRSYLPPLGSNTSNWLLALAPDLYLYGALMEAAPYLHEDDRIQVWAAGVEAGFKQLNDLNEEALYNAGPLVVRRKGRGYG